MNWMQTNEKHMDQVSTNIHMGLIIKKKSLTENVLNFHELKKMSNVLEATYSESDKCLNLLIPNQNSPSRAHTPRMEPYVPFFQSECLPDVGNQ